MEGTGIESVRTLLAGNSCDFMRKEFKSRNESRCPNGIDQSQPI
jgi:hypothetical protein